LLGEHGRQFAESHSAVRAHSFQQRRHSSFSKIEEGPKVKVGKIKFTGNHAFSDRKLIRAMRHDRPYSIPLYFWYIPGAHEDLRSRKVERGSGSRRSRPVSGQRLFSRFPSANPSREHRHAKHRLGVPLVAGRSHGKAVNITIPIEEGERYHMGTLKIVSADPDKALSLKVDALKGAFPLKQGDIFFH